MKKDQLRGSVSTIDFNLLSTLTFDPFQPARLPTEKRWMPGGRVKRLARFGVQPEIGSGYELPRQLTGEDQSTQPLTRLAGAGGHRLHRHFDHRLDESGRDAVPGDVGHEDADSVLIDGNEFIEVPGDGRHRTIRSVDVKSVDLWNAAGETTLR